ncbi:uncharacterized protein LOC100572761 isoform X2 [Acyrthosiphon pisum]|uniref:PH domain-containing protein n=1 Tax=Acyrthosiphon pisum TaxID=7029 RepID=A0A8R1WZ94_ACYPI|nr:uncharacterized protein LOC100572761 isoform X2 [Acyrthosiphon pisum]|eukprot:XP_008180199.1 PREDICTED: uncharacterized protein LOC100572761 isoform X2 [Acyrthosiphon pisum]
MDDFTERMLERTQRRQELLASTLSQVSQPVLPPSSAVMETSPTIQQSLSPPSRRQRRTRLAELASQVDQWLSDDQNFKQSENISNPRTNENKSAGTQQPKQKQYSNKLKQFRQEQQSDNGPLPQKHSPNLTATTLTVAQRRALFEPNNATQQQSKKPITTTTVTISLTKTTPATVITKTSTTAANETTEESVVDVIKTPPRPIPCSASTPPSRRGTRPRTSHGAAAASNNLTEQQRSVWTPPCIKNVLLKKKLINELEDGEQMPDNCPKDRVGMKSPFDKFNPDCIKYKPASPSANLYPDLSLIADDDLEIKTLMTPLETQSMACKRRSNGSSALNTSTASSESVPEDCDNAEILGAKRYRSEQKEKNPETIDVPALLEETSPSTPVTGINTTPGGGHCSMLSSHAGSPLSQACSSFIFHRGNESLCGNKSFSSSMDQRQGLEDQEFNAQANHLPESRLIDKYFEFVNSDGEEEAAELIPNNVLSPNQSGPRGRLQFDNSKHIVDNVEPDKHNSSSSSSSNSSSSGIKPALVHTVSTYRKQQRQLRLNGINSSGKQQMRIPEQVNEEQDDDTDEEEMNLQELDKVAARARDLERIVVPEQDRIIEQATQALNICDVYRQKNTLRPVISHQFSPEHVHAERLLLIAGLRRTDAVREAQRLRVERTLLPGGIMGERSTYLNSNGDGKTLVIQSLRVPILSSVNSGGNHNKIKHNSSEGLENLTRWPGGYRYFVCAIRAVATVHRPPVTAASRPADAVEESVLRFSNDGTTCRNKDEINYGYVEFITKKRVKNSGSRKCAGPTESEGAPIMIHGLDDRGWKITVELYGVSPTGTGENDHHNGGNNVKKHNVHENRSVLDKLWSTVTTPSKEAKKHHGSTATTCIESPGGPMAVRNTVFRQLGYFVFSDGQVDRKQFTLNKVHQSGGVPSSSRVTTNAIAEETVRVQMCLLEEGEQYEDDSGAINVDNKSLEPNTYIASGSKAAWAQKLLKFPSECKRLEGFLTLFDDHELRSHNFLRESKWQRRTDIGDCTKGGTTSWRRLWFRAEIIDMNQQKSLNNSDKPQKQENNINLKQRTIVLRYWMYPEYAEQEREPLGSIDLNCCLPPPPPEEEITTAALGQQQKHKQKPIPAAPALPDLCTRPNTLRLILYNVGAACDNLNDGNHGDDKTHEVLLLAADTADERREWCETVNAAVNAISEHRDKKLYLNF